MVETHEYGGFLWPINDKVTPPIVMKEVERLPLYLAHVPNRRVCVQAGGNVGVYAQRLSEHFEHVITMEPDRENFACLCQNSKAGNILFMRGALSDKSEMMTTWRTPKEALNYGATMVKSYKDNPSDGASLSIVLDKLPLSHLDFLFLDVEGYEFPALLGAAQTILRHKPTISVEIKGLGKHHGFSDDELRIWLTNMGYKEVDRIGRDVIFTHP